MLNTKVEQVADSKRNDTHVLNTKVETVHGKSEPPAICHQATLPDHAWAELQWGQVELGDKRLTQRAVEIGAKMAAHPDAPLPKQAQTRAMLVGSYRLMNNKRVDMTKLLAEVYKTTRIAAEQQARVLLIHDTTELDFTDHPRRAV